MLIKFSDTTKFPVKDWVVWDYPMPDDKVGISYQRVKSRVPEKGRCLNRVCHEMFFIVKGSGTFYVGDEVYEVKAKDLVIVEPKVKHHIETRGLEYVAVTRPDWYAEQYEEVD